MKPLNPYVISSGVDIERLILTFLRKITTVPLIDNVRWHENPGSRTLDVNLSGNPTASKENPVPGIYLTVGNERYQTLTVDAAAAYREEAVSLTNEQGKLEPEWKAPGKTSIILGSAPINLEVRLYGRRPCSIFSTRLMKVMLLFLENMRGLSNATDIAGLSKSVPQPLPEVTDAYVSNISFQFQFILLEELPALKDVAHQFVVSIITEVQEEDEALEQNFIIDTKDVGGFNE